jgi:hypothetical protein
VQADASEPESDDPKAGTSGQAADAAKRQREVVFLENFFDELRRKVPQANNS